MANQFWHSDVSFQKAPARYLMLFSVINPGWGGGSEYTQAQIDVIPKAHWPLVRTHPGWGRQLWFIGAHASQVVGLPVAEGRVLLAELLERATQSVHVYRHQWQIGDLVIWDNRATLHRGRRYDLTERRELRRTTTMDVACTG